MKTPPDTEVLVLGDGHNADCSAQPTADGRLTVDPQRDEYGDARHHGAAGDGQAQATAQTLLRL